MLRSRNPRFAGNIITPIAAHVVCNVLGLPTMDFFAQWHPLYHHRRCTLREARAIRTALLTSISPPGMLAAHAVSLLAFFIALAPATDASLHVASLWW